MKIAPTMQLELHFHPPFPLLCCLALNCCLAGATGFRSPDPYLRREGVISPNDDAGCYTAIIIIIILATTTTPTPYRHPSFHPHPPLGAYNKRQNLFTFITIIPCSFFANDDDRTPPWISCTLVDVVAAAPDDDATVAAFLPAAGCSRKEVESWKKNPPLLLLLLLFHNIICPLWQVKSISLLD